MTTYAIAIDLPADHLLRQLIDAIAAHPEVRQPLLRVLLTEDFLALPEKVDTLEGKVDALQESFEDFRAETRAEFRAVREETREQFRAAREETQEQFRGVQEQFRGVQEQFRAAREETQEQFRGVQGQFQGVHEQLQAITENLDETREIVLRVRGQVGRMRGLSYEDACRDKIGAILDGYLDGAVPADRHALQRILVQARRRDEISRYEYLQALNVDIVAREIDDEEQTGRLAVVEASVSFNRGDLETAARRAEIIRRVAGVRTDAFVATHQEWPDEVNAIARQLGVTIVRHEEPDFAYELE